MEKNKLNNNLIKIYYTSNISIALQYIISSSESDGNGGTDGSNISQLDIFFHIQVF